MLSVERRPVVPIILSGGSGTRLWPLSRESKPKQFLKFNDHYSLIQKTALRCNSPNFDSNPIFVCADDHRFLIAEEIHEIGINADIILEPVRRNSCAAITAGCLRALERSKDVIVVVLASDHNIPDHDQFSEAIDEAYMDADAGYLITFGLQPKFAATGYGYILSGEQLRMGGSRLITQFVEKPSRELAEQYVREGYLWNSGNFLFSAKSFIDELKLYYPEILEAVQAAYNQSVKDLDFLRLEKQSFEKSPSISVDYAVMSHTKKASVFPVDYHWSDVGSWNAIWEDNPKDSDGNSVIGDGHVLEGKNNLIHSEGKLTAMIGVDDVAVISTRDAVLVSSRENSEQVKQLVDTLREDGRAEANEALQIFRPWGNYERLDSGKGYQVKRLTIKPGGVLSLQKHSSRSEHWVVVQGNPEIIIGENVQNLEPNQSVYVPQGSVHRLANHGPEPVVLIEVQTGDYLGEDDIIRLEDLYNRNKNS